MLKYLLFSLIFVFFKQNQYLLAQEIYFTNISKTIGLPSQESYNVIQDSKGYIWICTENGILKYSKGNRKIFDKQNGLTENGVYFIAENKKNELELITAENRLLKLKNDVIHEHPLSKEIQHKIKEKALANSFDLAYFLNHVNQDEFIINTKQRSFLISEKKSSIEEINTYEKYKTDAFVALDRNNGNSYFIKSNPAIFCELKKRNNIVNLFVKNKNQQKTIQLKLLGDSRLDWRVRMSELGGYTFIIIHNNLIQIDRNLKIKIVNFESVITSLYVNETHGLWIGLSSGGVFHYPDFRKLNTRTHGLGSFTVSSILVDHEGGTWCTTIEKGIFYAGNYKVHYYPEVKELNKNVNLLKSIKNQLFISSEIDNLLFFENGKIKNQKLLITGNSDINDILEFKGQKYISSTGFFASLYPDFTVKKFYFNPLIPSSNITSYQLDTSSNHLYFLGLGLVYRLKKEKIDVVSRALNTRGRCFKVLNDSIIYVGCNDGLYKINTQKKIHTKIGNVNSIVTKIMLGKDGLLYFTTRGQGLFKLKNDKIYPISTKGSFIMNDIVQDKSGFFWITTNEGLIKIQKSGELYISNVFKTENGLMTNDLNRICIFKNDIYISSPDGLSKFSLETRLLNSYFPRVHFNKMFINNLEHSISKELHLKHWQNSLSFEVDQINFKGNNDESLVYTLKGYLKRYRKSNSNKISFDNLPPNVYELIIYTQNNDKLKSQNPLVLKFTIHPPFWETTWFILLTGMIFLLSIILTVRFVIQRIKTQEEEKTKINKLISESQMSALQAQMNPHFIFNAINSIQNYILDKKEDEAYNYLTKFSKLVRLVLNNSRSKEHSLQTELEILDLYIGLEQLRFDQAFEYQLIISKEINVFEVEIPTMLVQPYVENAIWHGLMNLGKNKLGILKIEISTDNHLLKISIEDNGIGREKSKQFKENSIHHSVAMQLTEERINIINRILNSKDIKVEIYDLYGDSNESIGTRVELFLPLN